MDTKKIVTLATDLAKIYALKMTSPEATNEKFKAEEAIIEKIEAELAKHQC